MIEILCRSEPEALILELVGESRAAGPALLSCLDAAMETECPTIVVDLGAIGSVDAATIEALREAGGRLAATGRALRLRGSPIELSHLDHSAPPRPNERSNAALGAVAHPGVRELTAHTARNPGSTSLR